MRKTFATALILLCSLAANALPLVWRADWPDAKPVETLVHRGTDVELQPLWRINKEPADTNGWTFTTFCQTNAVGPWFGPLPGAFFSHTNDVGAAFYNVMVRAQTPGGAVNYTAFARLRMLDSPGFAPGELPLPAKSIDFASVEVFNAPYYTKAETDAKIVELAPAPDFSTNNVALVETIEATAPAPGNYAAVSNAAVHAAITNALQDVELESLSGSISTLNDTKASKADATLTERGFTEWSIAHTPLSAEAKRMFSDESATAAANDYAVTIRDNDLYVGDYFAASLSLSSDGLRYAFLAGSGTAYIVWGPPGTTVATRTALPGYVLGSQSDKPLASEAEVEEVRQDNAQQSASIESNRVSIVSNSTAIAELTDTTSTLSDSISTLSADKADRSELADFATPADVYRIVAGTNVVLVVTNYNSTVHAPSMKLQHLNQETGEYVTYWDEARGHGITLTNAMDYADGVAARLDAAKAPRAWSRVTSGLGADAPEGTTFISTPVTHISGGFEFEKKITAGGTVWTLCSTSLAAGSTTNGFFEISALDGTPVFSVEKTDSVLVGVNASAIAVVDNACVISVPAVADTHPFARVATTLVNPTWYKETEDGMPAQSPATVSWSGQSGAWVATVDFGSSPQGFVFFEYLQEGGVKIVNSAVVDLSQGVHYGGATYMPTVSGNELKFIRQ